MRPLAPSLLTASALSIVGLQNAALPKAHPPSEGRSKATLLSSTAVAQISTPSTGAVLPVNSSITFQGGNQGGSIPDYCRWDFGDGAVLQSSTQVSHTYAAPGTYVVKLTTYTENRFNVFIPSATASISLTILAPPVIQAFSSSPSPINLRQSTTLTWSASGATALSLSGIGAVAGTSRVVTPPPPPGGTGAVYSVPYTLTASNAVGTARATTSVRVNRPPAFSAPSYGATLRQKNSAALALNPAGDPDGDTLTYALSGALPPGLTLDLGDPAHPTLKGTPSVPGTYALTLTAKDPGGFTCSAPWSIQVLPPLPTLSFRATPAAILQGQSSTLAWSATEATTLTLSGVGTVTGSSLVVTPSATTTYTLTATGLGGSTAASLTLSVDHPPAFSTSLAPQTLTAKRAFSLQLPGATDPDGDALSYSVGGLPPGLSFDPATLNLSGAPTSPGTWTLTETASDGRGGSCQQSAPFTVLPGDQAFTYDPNGNLLSDGTRSFEWDAENRLVAVVAGTHRSEFLYDGLGRRVGMVEKENGATVGQREYLWDGREPIQELSTDTGTSLRDFYPQGYEEGATALYYTRDHLGSIREVTDAQGQLRARYDYDPYGRMTKVAGDKDSPFG